MTNNQTAESMIVIMMNTRVSELAKQHIRS